MVGLKKKTLAEDLMETLLKEVDADKDSVDLVLSEDELDLNVPGDNQKSNELTPNDFLAGEENDFDDKSSIHYENTSSAEGTSVLPKLDLETQVGLNINIENVARKANELPFEDNDIPIKSLFECDNFENYNAQGVATQVIVENKNSNPESTSVLNNYKPKLEKTELNAGDKTVAVTGFHKKPVEDYQDKIKVSIGQNRSATSQGYAAWGGNGSEASLGQAENLRMAQEKILDLENDNENLRIQNEELLSAYDIIKERTDILTAQVNEYKNDKENIAESFKNETALLRGHLQRKEAELQKAQMKVDDLDSRLKFDMKKIRIRERELENRLELIRAEKNALVKAKDEQILDLRRKMDVQQMEVESYRQKCIDLNKTVEVNQDSFKRTSRALRLAMANLELQEENKPSLKKVD